MFKKLLLITAFVSSVLLSFAQTTISGTITSSDGRPAEHVNIELKESGKITVSDEAGNYQIRNIKDGSYTLVASFSGLQTQSKKIEIQGNSAVSMNISMSENAVKLNEVIVRSRQSINDQPLAAGKIQVNPMDLPQSITVVGRATIAEQQSQRLSDVIKNVNGVYLATTRGSTLESFSARGYSFSSSNLFKNGSRVNTAVMPEMSSLEKVEVLKGSAAILYGNVSPGGIINMVTKQPKFNYGAEFSLRAGSYGLIKPTIDVYGPISKQVAFRVNGTYEKADSYRDHVQSERFYVNPSFLFKLSNRTELLVQGDYLDHNFTPDFGIGSLDNTTIPSVPRHAFFGTPWQYNKIKQSTATALLKHRLNSSWSVNVTTSYQQYDRDYYSTERIQAKANGDFIRPLNKIESREGYMIGQVDVNGKFNTGKIGHTLLAGIDADRYFTTSYGFSNRTTYDTINILDASKFEPRSDIPAASKITKAETPVNRIGAYVQDLVSISEKLKVLVGVRWSQINNRPITTNYLLKDSIGKQASRIDKAFTPRMGIVYKPTKSTSAFISYAQSFTPNSNPNGNPLEPSTIDQYEAGIKNELLKGKLTANLTLYRIVNNNLAAVAQFLPDGTPNLNNLNLKELTGQTTSDGIEVDINAQPVNGLNIIAGYSYNNMRYTKVKEGKGNYVEGERLVNTPAHTANAGMFYTFQNQLKGLKIGAGVYYIGKRYGGWNNTQGQSQLYSRLIKVDDFTTVDISAGYTFKNLSLIAKVSNVFNTLSYYVHENYSVNPIAPTQFTATLSYKL